MTAPLPKNEEDRLRALRDCRVLDTPPEDEFDDITRLAAHICGVPIAAVSLVDAERQWFKSVAGLPVTETPRDMAFCAHTILQAGVLIVPDAHLDARFADNPLVTGDPNIRFYAGASLITEDGQAIGSLCVIDRIPRHLTADQVEALRLLARLATSQLEKSRRAAERERAEAERLQTEAERLRLAAIIETSDDAIYSMTREGRITSWNRGAERLYGYAAAEMVGRSADVLAGPGEQSPVPAAVTRLLRGEAVGAVEAARTRRDGVESHAALSFSPMRDAAGRLIGLSCIARDITARKQAEAALAVTNIALAESEARLRLLTDAAFEGIAISQGGVLVDVSPAYAALFGYAAPAEMAGLPASPPVAPASRALALQKEAGHDDEPYEAVLLRRDGSTFQAEMRGRMISLGGRHARVTAVRDISEQRAMEERLRESEARFRTSVDAMEEGLTLQDADGAILFCNGSAERILGLSADQMMGRTSLDPRWRSVHEDGTDFPGEDHPATVALRECTPQPNVVMGVHKPDGAMTWVNINAVPLLHALPAGGRGAHGVVVTFSDVTERRQAEEALRAQAERLRRSEAALRAVLESAPVILYAADADGTVTLSEGTGLASLGLKPGEAVGRSVFDFSGGDAGIEANTRRALAGEALSYDAHVYGLSLHTELRPLRDADGASAGIIGVCFDVTERVASEERFRVLFERSSDAHLLVGAGGIIDCNNAAVALMRCADKTELLSLHPSFLSPERQPDGRRSREKSDEMEGTARRSGFHRFEWTHRRMDGEEFPVEVALTPVTLADRPVMLAVLHDLTERKRAEEAVRDHAVVLEFQKQALEQANAELEALATTDGMTGLKNHLAFQEQLTEEVSRAGRHHTPLSLVLLDVDHFKGFNDAFGHPAGDAVLKDVARILQESARETDLVARYGGEEFALLLPQTDAAGAALFAERLRAAVEAAPWPLRAVTGSFGVACLRPSVENGDCFITRADDALYLSKAGGRNRVTVGSAPAPLLRVEQVIPDVH